MEADKLAVATGFLARWRRCAVCGSEPRAAGPGCCCRPQRLDSKRGELVADYRRSSECPTMETISIRIVLTSYYAP